MLKEDFIVGNWYKINDRYIAKFKEINKEGFFIAENGYYIDCNNPEKKLQYISNMKISQNWENSIEISLKEIQEYLPKDHPDKFLTLDQLKDLAKKVIEKNSADRIAIKNKLKEFNEDRISNLPIKFYKEFELFLNSLLRNSDQPKPEVKGNDNWLEKNPCNELIKSNLYNPIAQWQEEQVNALLQSERIHKNYRLAIDTFKEIPVPIIDHVDLLKDTKWELSSEKYDKLYNKVVGKLKFIKEYDCKEVINKKVNKQTNIKFL